MAERLQRLEGVNILRRQVGAEWVEWGHVAVENTGEHQRMIGKKFYVTKIKNIFGTKKKPDSIHFLNTNNSD